MFIPSLFDIRVTSLEGKTAIRIAYNMLPPDTKSVSKNNYNVGLGTLLM